MTANFVIEAKKLFISYRRSDAESHAREIYRAITDVLPPANVFFDQESIPPGVNFLEFLDARVAGCDVLLALIGSGWIDAIAEGSETRRLDSSDDLVRRELRMGLERGITFVPVLLDGAGMPDTSKLPDDLKGLVWQNAVHLSGSSINSDVVQLLTRTGIINRAAREVYEAAVGGNADAMGRLADAYAYGRSNRGAIDEDDDTAPLYSDRARQWLELASRVGNAKHWQTLGLRYWWGGSDWKFMHNPKMGRELLERAHNHSPTFDTAYSLAKCYELEAPEKVMALWRFMDDVHPNDAYLKEKIASFYIEGKGVKMDVFKARHWYKRALSAQKIRPQSGDSESLQRQIKDCDDKIAKMGIMLRIMGRFGSS